MYEILCNIYVELPMEAKSLLPKLPRILQAINEMGISFNLSLGVGEGWDKEWDLPRPLLCLGDIFYFTVDASTSKFCGLKFDHGESTSKGKESNFVDIKWKVCCFNLVVSSGAVDEICPIRCTFFHCNIEIVNNRLKCCILMNFF